MILKNTSRWAAVGDPHPRFCMCRTGHLHLQIFEGHLVAKNCISPRKDWVCCSGALVKRSTSKVEPQCLIFLSYNISHHWQAFCLNCQKSEYFTLWRTKTNLKLFLLTPNMANVGLISHVDLPLQSCSFTCMKSVVIIQIETCVFDLGKPRLSKTDEFPSL